MVIVIYTAIASLSLVNRLLRHVLEWFLYFDIKLIMFIAIIHICVACKVSVLQADCWVVVLL